MRVVFMGTPSFSATILSYLSEQHEVVGVFTRPDTVRSRGKKLLPSPVKEVSLNLGIPVYECTSFAKDSEAFNALKALNPEVVVVAAFSVLLPKSVLDLPKYGCVNVHASLLPRWRGAAPVERAILAGDRQAGVCIMKMEEGLDTGDYCIERSCDIGSFTAEELTSELAELGSQALLTCLEHLELGASLWIKQDENKVTYASKIEKGELDIDPSYKGKFAQACVQASSESHPCRCFLAGKEVALIKTRLCDEADEAITATIAPGEVVFAAKCLYIGLSQGVLEVLLLKPSGKKVMDGKSFAAGIQGIKNGGFTWEGING